MTLNPGQWSRNYDKCTQCGTTDIPYGAKGLCKKCYRKKLYVPQTTGRRERRIEESGNVYGKLTVVSYEETRGSEAYWRCICECGNARIACGTELRRNTITHCGCNSPTRKRVYNNIDRKIVKKYYSYKGRAKKKGIAFDFTRDEFYELVQAKCHYCEDSAPGAHIGLDRIDSNLGYTRENVVPCCTTCNVAKMALGYKEFLRMVEKIYFNLIYLGQ
jgi:hypothetical protein